MKIYPTNEGFNSAESQPISQSTSLPITFADFRSPNSMILPTVLSRWRDYYYLLCKWTNLTYYLQNIYSLFILSTEYYHGVKVYIAVLCLASTIYFRPSQMLLSRTKNSMPMSVPAVGWFRFWFLSKPLISWVLFSNLFSL